MNRIKAAILGVATVGTLGLVAPAPASASSLSSSDGCSIKMSLGNEVVYCNAQIAGGNNQFRAHTKCADGAEHVGPWRWIGGGITSVTNGTCIWWPTHGLDKRRV